MTRTGRPAFAPCGLALLLPTLVLVAGPWALSAAIITEYPLPAGSLPNFLVFAHDGSVAFTEYGTDKIGRLKDGVVTHLSTSAGCGPVGITLGADGFLYYTCIDKKALGFLKFDLLDPTEIAVTYQPLGPIVSGPGGNLWYTGEGVIVVVDRQITFLDFAATGSATSYFGVASGGDGGVWAVNPSNGLVVR